MAELNLNFNILDREQMSALHRVFTLPSLHCCALTQCLIDLGVNPCFVSESKRQTALHLLAQREQMEKFCFCIPLIMGNSKDSSHLADSKNKEGHSPLEIAISKSNHNYVG